MRLLTIFAIFILAFNLSAFDLTIARMNDNHSHCEPEEISLYFDIDVDGDGMPESTKTKTLVGGYPRIVTAVEELRANNENVVFLQAGDVFQGTLYFTEYLGMADLYFLEMMGLDVMCAGNHEFDNGPATLADFVNEADFPIVCANADFSQDSDLNGMIEPYAIKEIGGEQIGIIGVITEEIPMISSPGEDITFSDRIQAVQNSVSALQNEGVNKIIVLSHCGFDADSEMISQVNGIDIVVGGHSHDLFGTSEFDEIGMGYDLEYPTVINDMDGNPVYMAQAWEHGKLLGVMDVTFDDDGIVTAAAGNPIVLAGNSFRPEIEGEYTVVNETEYPDVYNQIISIVNGCDAIDIYENNVDAQAQLEIFAEPIVELYETEIASIPEDLPHVRIPGVEYSGLTLEEGSHIAPIVCDGMLWKANQVGLDADIVIQNAGGVRISIPAGQLTIGQVYELMPFSNTLVAIDLTGAEVISALLDGINGAVGRGSGAFPYVAGCKFDVDATDNSNIVMNSVMVPSGNEWVAIDENATYRVVTNSFAASGGDGYDTFANASGYFYDTGFVDAEVFVSYAEEVETLVFPDDNRITITHPVDNETNSIEPFVAQLNGNFPNPFNPNTSISFSINQDETVKISIYNVKGQVVKTLVNKKFSAGTHTLVWNGKDNSNSYCSSGIYFTKLKTKDKESSVKMMLIK